MELSTSLGDSIQFPENSATVKALERQGLKYANAYSTGLLFGLEEKVFKIDSIALDSLKVQYPLLHAVKFPSRNPRSHINRGWLGCGIWKRFNAYFDFPRQMLYLEPNNLLNSPDLYNSTGLYVIKSSDNNIVVQNIAPGSPAEKAGIKVGDIVLKIKQYDSNQMVFDRIYYIFSAESGTLIPLLLERNGKQFNVTLRTETPF